MSPSFKKGKRSVASLFEKSRNKTTLSYTWTIDSNPTLIARSTSFPLSYLTIKDTAIKCEGSNIVKVHEANKIIMYLTANSDVRCRADKPKEVQVDYTYFDYSLSEVNNLQLEKINRVLKDIDQNKLANSMDNIEKLGLSDLFDKKMKISELRQIPFKDGDYVKVSIWPQMKKVKCPEDNCELQVDVFGLLDYEKMGIIRGMNQLKYQQVPPFLVFCGSKFTAGNIYFRADEKMEFEHIINENGFSCDINSFLLKSDLEYEIRLKWISKEKIQSLLLGKREEFIKEKNLALKNKLNFYLNETQALNNLIKDKSTNSKKTGNSQGHIELWWEPFDKCESKDVECQDKELVVTRSRYVYNDKAYRITKDFPLIPMGIKQNISAEDGEPLIAFVAKVCPQDLSTLIEDQLIIADQKTDQETFLKHIKSYESKSCDLKPGKAEDGKSFQYRWLLASIPKEIEKEEVDIVIEDYKLLDKPSEKRIKNDPLQTGKVFFDIYMKNLKKREVRFKRSRIIEVLK